MRFEKYLKEKYEGRNRDVEVFVNPTRSEMREAGGSNGQVRFTAIDKEKKLYVFNAGRALHIDVWEDILGKTFAEYTSASNKTVLHAIATFGTKWIMTESDELESGHLDRDDYIRLYKRFKWVEKWISLEEYLMGQE